MGLIKWFRLIKEEQIRLERESKIHLFNIVKELREIKSLIELSLIRVPKRG